VNFNFNAIELPFTDFCVLALLLALLYGITAVEAWISPKGQAATGISMLNRKTAASFAFFGVLATLVAGVLSAADNRGIDFLYLGVPLAFLAHWAWFHYLASDLVDPQVLQDILAKSYEDAVVQVIAERSHAALSVEEVRALALESSLYARLLVRGHPLLKGAAPVPVVEIITRLIPSVDMTRTLVDSLAEQGRIVKLSDGKISMVKVDDHT